MKEILYLNELYGYVWEWCELVCVLCERGSFVIRKLFDALRPPVVGSGHI